MSRIEVQAGSVQAKVGQLGELGRELGGVRAALDRLEGASGAAWSPGVAAALAGAEEAWADSVGAMGFGAQRAGASLEATARAYAQTDHFPALTRHMGGP